MTKSVSFDKDHDSYKIKISVVNIQECNVPYFAAYSSCQGTDPSFETKKSRMVSLTNLCCAGLPPCVTAPVPLCSSNKPLGSFGGC